ncbi:MAG: metallo-mystery pair system four-Cys motif protein [Acidobacteria bacterium]|nr:metallo-mystery pair system four-Cys motif protein [Acidobacteriota bacterium]
MKNQTRLFKLFALAFLVGCFAIAKDWQDVSAHEGHKKGHAPVTAKKLRNPVPHNTQNIENGKALYEQNCAVCHGSDGKGVEYNKKARIKVPDLTSHYVMNLTDGEIFYVETNGIKTSGMPGFKLKASDRERWQMVHYVKHFGMTAEDHAAMAGNAEGAKTQEVALRFKPMVGDKAFACGQSYDNIGTTNSKITPTDFRFYVHNVRLVDAAGKETPVALEQDGKWQVDNIALLDFENGSGPCANGTADTNDVIKGKALAGNYTGVKFTVGVPFECNHADLAKAPSPLNLTQLFWVWNSGYKFARIEMQTTGLPTGWMLHLGSTGCQPGGTAQTIPKGCDFPNRAEITLNNFNINGDVVITDLKQLLNGANMDVNQPKTARGCMSGQNDADCAPLFANIGLKFAGKDSSGQKFFAIEKGTSTAQLGKMPGVRN